MKQYNIDPIIREYIESLKEMTNLINCENGTFGMVKYDIEPNAPYMYECVRRFELAFENMINKTKNINA